MANIIFFVCTFTTAVFLSNQIQYTVWPEMIIYPYITNHGFALYKEFIMPYPPLSVWVLQLVEGIFGYLPEVTRYITLILLFINMVIIKILAGKLWKDVRHAGHFAVLFYIPWFFYFEGNALWFESFQTPLILISLYFLYNYFFENSSQKNLIIGSAFLTLSFLIKQSTLWVFIGLDFFLILFYIKRQKDFLNISLKIAAVSLFLVGLTFLIALIGGYHKEYWFWAYEYVLFKLPFNSDYQNYPTLSQVFRLWLPFAALIPFVILGFMNIKKTFFLLSFLLPTFMFSLPRWEYFHLQTFAAVYSAIALPAILGMIQRNTFILKIGSFVLLILWMTMITRHLQRFEGKPVRFFEPDMYKLAEEIKDKNYQPFYLYNTHEQLYPLTNSVPIVKPYVQYFASFMEFDNAQPRVVTSLEEKKIKYIIYTPPSGKGGVEAGDYRPKIISDYINQNYHFKEKLRDNVWVLERN